MSKIIVAIIFACGILVAVPSHARAQGGTPTTPVTPTSVSATQTASGSLTSTLQTGAVSTQGATLASQQTLQASGLGEVVQIVTSVAQALLAGALVWINLRYARDSKRQADAAERTLHLARQPVLAVSIIDDKDHKGPYLYLQNAGLVPVRIVNLTLAYESEQYPPLPPQRVLDAIDSWLLTNESRKYFQPALSDLWRDGKCTHVVVTASYSSVDADAATEQSTWRVEDKERTFLRE